MGRSNSLSASEAASAIAAGRLKSVVLAEACLERVAKREPEVGAWAHIDPAYVIAQARERDREPPRGPLHGVPVAIKDIIDTADMPTAYGSPIYEGHRPKADAGCVALLRAAGAVIMGKTVTAEFAMRHPGKTRNPLNLAHTPGGSSSGSAAAVADGMAPLALGTQTSGSVIRPAAFCGIVGFKPTYHLISTVGVKPNAISFDTVGMMARTIDDIALAFCVLTEDRRCEPQSRNPQAPRIAFYRTPQWKHADEATARAFAGALPVLARRGAHVEEITLPEVFDGLLEAKHRMNDYETVRALAWERREYPQRISRSLSAKLDEAEACTIEQYVAAREHVDACKRALKDVCREWDALFVPATTGEAPRGIQTTGDSVFNRIWTALHVPAVTVPVFTGPSGLPIGAQVIGPFGGDYRTLAVAEWVRRALTDG
ncbi:MAG: amidase [Burkholderiales bacterium]